MGADVSNDLQAILARLDAMIDAPGDPLKTPPHSEHDPIYAGAMRQFGDLLEQAWQLVEADPHRPGVDRYQELHDFYSGQLALRLRRMKPRLDDLADRRASAVALRDQIEMLEREIDADRDDG